MARIDRFYADPVTVSGYADPALAGDLYIVHEGGGGGRYECRAPARTGMGEFLYDGLRGDEPIPSGPGLPSYREAVMFAAGFLVARWLYVK